MNGMKILAIVLLVLGVLGLAYGGFGYTRSTSHAEMGPISIEVKDRQRVNVPMWAGIVLVVVGGALLVVPARKS